MLLAENGIAPSARTTVSSHGGLAEPACSARPAELLPCLYSVPANGTYRPVPSEAISPFPVGSTPLSISDENRFKSSDRTEVGLGRHAEVPQSVECGEVFGSEPLDRGRKQDRPPDRSDGLERISIASLRRIRNPLTVRVCIAVVREPRRPRSDRRAHRDTPVVRATRPCRRGDI